MDFFALKFKPPKGQRLTKNQLQWNKEITNLQRRVRTWEKTKGLIFQSDITKPKAVRQKNLQEIKRITFKSLSDKAQYQEAYIKEHPDITFAQAEKFGYRGTPLQQVAALKNDRIPSYKFAEYPELLQINIRYEEEYEPRTEEEWESESDEEELARNWIEPEYPEDSVDKTPVVQEYELQAFIDQFIAELTETEGKLHPSAYKSPGRYKWYKQYADESAEKFRELVDDAIDRMGRKNFYKFIANAGTQESLLEIANRVYALYLTSDGTYENKRQTEVAKFAQILNGGKPLSEEQKMQFDEEELEL